MSINIKEIAKIAGVSSSTVSRVLSNKEVVSKETREKILKIAKEYNYQPNVLAQSLKNGQSNAVALLIPSVENGYFVPIIKGVTKEAREKGYSVILCNTDENAEIEKSYIDKLTGWVDGFIISSAQNGEKNLDELTKNNIPVVLVTRYLNEQIGKMNIISIDNNSASYEATKYLISLGHKTIAFASGNQELLFYRERLSGYKRAMEDANLKPLVFEADGDDDDDFVAATKKLMNSNKVPTAIFASSDNKVLSIVKALQEMKIKIPEKVSLLGFDNLNISEILNPSLSSVSQPLDEFGKVAANNLINQIAYKNKNGVLPTPIRHILDFELIIRESTRRV